eukprot:gene8761-9696_t
MAFQAITVYCGSSPGKDPAFMEAANELGKLFVSSNIKLIYGGGDSGLMGQIARTVSDGGGQVLGVTPEFMHTEGLVTKVGPGENVVIDSMHDRKQYMFDHADAFIALPGGYGTLEELVEMITWAQLGLHKKPIGILNINNYYKGFLDWVAHADNEKFLYNCTSIFIESDNPKDLMSNLIDRKRSDCNLALDKNLLDSGGRA